MVTSSSIHTSTNARTYAHTQTQGHMLSFSVFKNCYSIPTDSGKNATRQQEEVQSSRKKEVAQQRRISSVINTYVVVALEIGTCNTKAGFAFTSLLPQITPAVVIMDHWKHTPGSMEVETTILFNHKEKVIAYGTEAEELFRNLSIAERESVYFFKNFIDVFLDMKTVSLPIPLCEHMADPTQCFTILYYTM